MMDTLKSSKLARFIAIGGINTVLDFGILFLLSKVGLPTVPANIISTSVAFVFSFFMNKKYTFKTTDTNVKRELALFIIVTLFGLWVLQNIVIEALKPIAMNYGYNKDIAALIAKVPATIVSMIWNYFAYDRWVFKQKKD